MMVMVMESMVWCGMTWNDMALTVLQTLSGRAGWMSHDALLLCCGVCGPLKTGSRLGNRGLTKIPSR